MTTPRTLFSLGLSALVLGGTVVGCTAGVGGIASASSRAADRSARSAAQSARTATKALARHDDAMAVTAAEQAVAMAPRIPAYRVTLGQAYLQAGRFASASAAYADAIALAPGDDAIVGKAALNLALAQTATGDWRAARETLAAHGSVIPAADRGLALALAGDTAGAITDLTEVARSPQANATVRQNLALSYALAGRWQEARVVAAADLSPADVDGRLQQWAAFAQPRTASDQVATLLGVTPAADLGQPIALALVAPAAPVAVAQLDTGSAAPAPVVVAAETPAVTPLPVAAPAQATAPVPAVAFAPHTDARTPTPLADYLIRRAEGPAKIALHPPVARVATPAPAFAGAPRSATQPVRWSPAGGAWFVQLGAFENAGVARDAWSRAKRRFAVFAGHQPNGATYRTASRTFYRLSVGGFARGDADAACRRYRAVGGACFVRRGAGDSMAQWTRPAAVQLASR